MSLTPLAAALQRAGLRSAAVMHRRNYVSWYTTGPLLHDLLFCGTRRW